MGRVAGCRCWGQGGCELGYRIFLMKRRGWAQTGHRNVVVKLVCMGTEGFSSGGQKRGVELRKVWGQPWHRPVMNL